MENSVDATFIIGRDEYIRAIRRHYRSQLSLTRDVIGGLVALCAGLYLLLATQQFALSLFLIIPGALLLGLVVYALTLLPSMLYRSQPKLKSEYRLHFDDSGIGFRTNDIHAHLKWQMYHSWLHDDEFYILYHGTRDLSVIPRRSLTEEGNEQFAAMLERNLGPCRAK